MLEKFDLHGTLVPLFTAWGMRVLGAVAVLVIGIFVAKFIRSWVRRGLARSRIDATLIPFLSSLVHYALVAIVGVAVLGLFGIQTASIVAILGAAAFAVGLALQGTLSHFASGVMLLAFRPFRIGDFVETGDTTGTVEEIGIFMTHLNTPDNVRVIVPNSAIFGQLIKNYTTNDIRRVDMVIGVSYADDIGKALGTVKRVLRESPLILDMPETVVEVLELGDSSVNLAVRPWVKKEDYWTVWFTMHRTLKEELEAAGCSIPFPQRDVHLFPERPAIQAG
jgi:small conductance mechanosensitive channel